MKKSVVTAKGQVVIPARLRRKYGIKKGTPVSVSDRNGEIVLQPLTDEFIRSLAGIAKTWGKGDLLKTLREFKKREREL
ncbi:MAG: AbrB/MazE/SpoVT family DNA-binding domain-containing protein [Terriglobia bacterium]